MSNEQLREALQRIQYKAVSLADAQVIALEALASQTTPPAAPSQEPAVPQGPVCAALGDIVSMWDQHVPSEYVTPLHMQAKRALAGQQSVSPDMHGWCAYVGGMVAHWIKSEPYALTRIGEERFEAAIAGIIERRLWAMPKSAATPAAPSQEPAVPQGWTDADSDAARLALELECLLLDTENLSVVSKWWASANDALELHRRRLATPAAPSQDPYKDSTPHLSEKEALR